jgi:hypothetical protein
MKKYIFTCLLLALMLTGFAASADTRYYLLQMIPPLGEPSRTYYLTLNLGERDANNVTEITGSYAQKLYMNGQQRLYNAGDVEGRIEGDDITLYLQQSAISHHLMIKATFVDMNFDLLEGEWQQSSCFSFSTGSAIGTEVDGF